MPATVDQTYLMTSPYFRKVAIVTRPNVNGVEEIVETPPALRFLLHRPMRWLQSYCSRHGWLLVGPVTDRAATED